MSDKSEAKKILQSITKDLTEADLKIALLLVECLGLKTGPKDYEGKQTFFIEDYKRRN